MSVFRTWFVKEVKRCINPIFILLLLCVSYVSASEPTVTIPVERLESWIERLEDSEAKTKKLEQESAELTLKLKNLIIDSELLQEKIDDSQANSLKLMTDLSILQRDYRILEKEYQEYFKKCTRMQKKITRRTSVLGGSGILNIILILILIF